MNSQTVLEIEKNLPNEWKFLQNIYDILCEGNVLNTTENSKIVEVINPTELKEQIDLTLQNDKIEREQIINLLKSVIKYSVKTNHPHFRNQLFGQMDPWGLVGAWISEALNTSAYTYEVAPVFSLIEMEIIQTLCKLCGFSEGDGIFSPGGSISNMYAIVLARYFACPEIKVQGLSGIAPLTMFTSEESHYSLKKAAHWIGIGVKYCILVKTNNFGQMLSDDLESKIIHSRKNNEIPFFVNATAGTTVLGAFDNLVEIGQICDKYKLWLHVDACHGGSVILSKQYSYRLNGLANANSFAWDPHKALGAPLQCAIFLTKNKNLLTECNAMNVSYLFQQDKYYDIDYDTGNKSVQCGRKIDAFKLWVMLKARGLNSFGTLVDHSIRNALLFTKKIEARIGFRLVQTEFEFTNVCFWYIPKNMRNLEENEDWYAKLNKIAPMIKEKMVKTGSIMIGYSPLPYKNMVNFFRMIFTCFSIINERDLDFLIKEIEKIGEECI